MTHFWATIDTEFKLRNLEDTEAVFEFIKSNVDTVLEGTNPSVPDSNTHTDLHNLIYNRSSALAEFTENIYESHSTALREVLKDVRVEKFTNRDGSVDGYLVIKGKNFHLDALGSLLQVLLSAENYGKIWDFEYAYNDKGNKHPYTSGGYMCVTAVGYKYNSAKELFKKLQNVK